MAKRPQATAQNPVPVRRYRVVSSPPLSSCTSACHAWNTVSSISPIVDMQIGLWHAKSCEPRHAYSLEYQRREDGKRMEALSGSSTHIQQSRASLSHQNAGQTRLHI